jgi:hypothetical protein
VSLLDWLLEFGGKVLAVPELHALLMAFAVGCALTYLFTQSLPAVTLVKTAVRWKRVIIFFVVFGIAVALRTTPVMVGWAFTVAILTPKVYEWGETIIYHRWPWLKPRALMTGTEMQCRVMEKERDA